MKKIVPIILLSLTGCAIGSGVSAGSAVSFYSLNSKQATSLSKEAEDRIVLKAVKEVSKMKGNGREGG